MSSRVKKVLKAIQKPKWYWGGLVLQILGVVLALFSLVSPYWMYFGDLYQGLYYTCLDGQDCELIEYTGLRKSREVCLRIVQVLFPMIVFLGCLSLAFGIKHGTQRSKKAMMKQSFPVAAMILGIVSGVMMTLVLLVYNYGVYLPDDDTFHMYVSVWFGFAASPLLILGGGIVRQSAKTSRVGDNSNGIPLKEPFYPTPPPALHQQRQSHHTAQQICFVVQL